MLKEDATQNQDGGLMIQDSQIDFNRDQIDDLRRVLVLNAQIIRLLKQLEGEDLSGRVKTMISRLRKDLVLRGQQISKFVYFKDLEVVAVTILERGLQLRRRFPSHRSVSPTVQVLLEWEHLLNELGMVILKASRSLGRTNAILLDGFSEALFKQRQLVATIREDLGSTSEQDH